MWPLVVEQEKVWIEFITANGLQPLPVRAVVMLALRSCLTRLYCIGALSVARLTSLVKEAWIFFFCSLGTNLGNVLRFLSATDFAVNRKFALVLQGAS